MLCKHCNCNSKLVCSTCGAVVDEAELILEQLEQIRPFDLAYYQTIDKKIIFIDHAVVDRILPHIRSSSGKVLMFFIASTKGGENIAFEEGFTYAQLMKGTGIKSTGTMHLALAELGDGLPATKRRKAIKGWNLIVHVNDKDKKKSKFVYGNRWRLNTDRVLEGVAHKLFNAGEHGTFFMMSPWIVLNLFPTLTGDQAMILTFIHRMTIGWSREENSMTYNFFTGWRRPSKDDEAGVQFEFFEEEQQENYTQSAMSSRKGVKNVLGQLVALNLVIKKEAKDPRYGHIYSLNKELLVTLELRARYPQPSDICLQPSDIYPQPSDVCPQPSDIYPQATRHVPPLNNDLKTTSINENDVNKKNETIPPNPPAKTDNEPLYELTELLSNTETTDGMDKLPLSEQAKPTSQDTNGLEKLTREKRQDILTKDFGLRSTTAINKALDYLDQGMMTDGNIQLALQHKADYPLCGPGIYADYFTMKVKNGVVCGLRPMSEAEMNGSDTAPKSPPPSTNGHGAAPPPSPTPPNGDELPPLPSPATVWQVTQDLLNQNPLLLNGLGKNLPYLQLESIENGLITVTAPPRVAESLTKQPGVMTRALNQAMQHLDQDNGGHGWRVRFVSNVAQSDDAVWWHDTKAALQQQMTQATYSSVIRGTVFMACEGNVFVIGVRNKMALDWLENRLVNTVQRVLSSVVGKEVTVKFELLEAL